MSSIVVMIDKEGGATIEAVGYEGSSCATATRPLEDALGVIAARDFKPEYHTVPLPADNVVEEF